ncbi:MAG: hypothetical protein JST05_09150 [Acidobacteria bacterium]|nr:hypothetical protein [Acidobacteriota bacterium]
MKKRVFKPLLVGCLLAVVGGCHTRGSVAGATRTAKGYGFAFDYSAALFKSYKVEKQNRWTEQDNGDGVPSGTAPAHVKFTLSEKVPDFAREKGGDAYTEATVEIIPLADPGVSDFDKSYPDLVRCAADIRRMVKIGIPKVAPGADLPEWGLSDAAQTIHAKPEVIATAWCSGIQYLGEETQEDRPIENNGLTYLFQGVSKDGAYYVSVSLPVAHRILSAPNQDVYNFPSDRLNAYYRETETHLSSEGDSSFSPSLADLKALVLSIRPIK